MNRNQTLLVLLRQPRRGVTETLPADGAAEQKGGGGGGGRGGGHRTQRGQPGTDPQ